MGRNPCTASSAAATDIPLDARRRTGHRAVSRDHGRRSRLARRDRAGWEILAWKEGKVLPFAQLQRRIGRKSLTRKLLAEVPVTLMTFDLLEDRRQDVRERPLRERRARLEELLASLRKDGLAISPRLEVGTWAELAAHRGQSRSSHTEGVMLKRLDSPYRVGRVRGDWWKWKIDPHTVDAVLIYAQRG